MTCCSVAESSCSKVDRNRQSYRPKQSYQKQVVRTFKLWCDTGATLYRKVGSCDINAVLERNRCLCRSGRPSRSHLGQKSHAKSVGMAKSGLEGASRSKVWRVRARCSVGVMGIAREPPRRSPDLSQVGGQSLSKRQVI